MLVSRRYLRVQSWLHTLCSWGAACSSQHTPSSLPLPQASLWSASWCCCLSTFPGPRSASRGWAWCTSWPACRRSWAPCSITCSWTTREGSPSTTPSWSSTCVGSAWSTRWVSLLLRAASPFCLLWGRVSLLTDGQWFTVVGFVWRRASINLYAHVGQYSPWSEFLKDYWSCDSACVSLLEQKTSAIF